MTVEQLTLWLNQYPPDKQVIIGDFHNESGVNINIAHDIYIIDKPDRTYLKEAGCELLELTEICESENHRQVVVLTVGNPVD